MGKKEDRSILDLTDVNTLVPMPDAMAESTNEMDNSTRADRGYKELVSTDDLSHFDALVNSQLHGYTSNTIKGNVGEGAQSPANQDKTLGTHLAESIQSMTVSTSRKRKALAIQNEDEAGFLPKRKEILDAISRSHFNCTGCWLRCSGLVTACVFRKLSDRLMLLYVSPYYYDQ
ncbi:hypothetical protein V6N11_036631 [Hibiscus sabdariffa]|uniref:Uncharacterized protein n=1 Tax=Hibiscus sabdariffa TaxID=183260 RepID=A0ABR2RBG0_9ROSI